MPWSDLPTFQARLRLAQRRDRQQQLRTAALILWVVAFAFGALLCSGCYGNGVTGPKVVESSGADHTGDPCWEIVAKLPFHPPARPTETDTVIVWGHIAGCSHG